MSPEQREFLSLRWLPAVLDREQAAWFTGFTPTEIDILSNQTKLLCPLGSPPPNGKKLFALAQLERLKGDITALDNARGKIIAYWIQKNRSRTGNHSHTY